MGTISGTTYHPTTLVKLPSKGDYWYVQATLPKELQGKNRQKRLSTGTTDRRKAERRQHEITLEIYREFDERLASLDRETPEPTLPYAIYPMTDEQSRIYRMMHPERVLASMQLAALDTSGNPNLGEVLPDYLASRDWPRIKTMKEYETWNVDFAGLVGNIPVAQVKKRHAYDYAKHLAEAGYANKTIASRVSKVTGLLKYCEQRGIIDTNPFVNLDLARYGRPKKEWLPFERPDMEAIFAQSIPPQERLLLSMLCATGARLDEVALLEWEQIVKRGQITYLELREAGKIKNQNSKRMVPLHPVLELPTRGKGRLFDYTRDRDGKASTSAGRHLRPHLEIIHHPRKVVHSFRGAFKDMMRDAGCPEDVHDWITGHGAGDVNKGYGRGPSLAVRYEWIAKLDLEFLRAF